MAGASLHVRQATEIGVALPSSATSLPITVAIQPTVTIALTTTFTPPASCASNRVTILPPSAAYYMWVNEPVPFGSTTVSDCYPSEFLKSYTSVSAGVTGSSIVPVMSPLVCPKNYCTMYAGDDNYIACCPSGYIFQGPTTTPTDPNRPAYGGTCYSGFTVSSTLTALQYDSAGSTAIVPWWATQTGYNAFAHPIDGFATSSPSLGCPAGLSSNSTLTSLFSSVSSGSNSSSTNAPLPTVSTGLSTGGIVGVVLGSVAGLTALISLIFLALRRRRRDAKNNRSESSREIHRLDGELAATTSHEMDGANTRYEKDSRGMTVEIGGDGRTRFGQGGDVHEMSGSAPGDDAHELPAWEDRAKK